MGHLRQLVLNIVRFNRATKECLVVSMYGEQSDWYQNIQAHQISLRDSPPFGKEPVGLAQPGAIERIAHAARIGKARQA